SSPSRVWDLAIIRLLTSSSTSTPSGISSAQAPLSDKKIITVLSSSPVSSKASIIRPIPWSILSICAAYTSIHLANHSLFSASSHGGCVGSRSVNFHEGSIIPFSIILSNLSSLNASQPASKRPRYFLISLSFACNGQCGAVYATYWKNGSSG